MCACMCVCVWLLLNNFQRAIHTLITIKSYHFEKCTVINLNHCTTNEIRFHHYNSVCKWIWIPFLVLWHTTLPNLLCDFQKNLIFNCKNAERNCRNNLDGFVFVHNTLIPPRVALYLSTVKVAVSIYGLWHFDQHLTIIWIHCRFRVAISTVLFLALNFEIFDLPLRKFELFFMP